MLLHFVPRPIFWAPPAPISGPDPAARLPRGRPRSAPWIRPTRRGTDTLARGIYIQRVNLRSRLRSRGSSF
eukprot:10563994-Alexandrium_andersonii.AAC.1